MGDKYTPIDWQGFSTHKFRLLKYLELFQLHSKIDEANQQIQQVKQIIKQQTDVFLKLTEPNNPCGDYLKALLKDAEIVFTLVNE